jgi:hypothetical protein
LNPDALAELSAPAFRQQRPYPWADIPNTLTAEGYERLRADLPDAAKFTRIEFEKTAGSGVGHDRLLLHYQQGMPLPGVWQEFLAELRGPEYAGFIRRMCGVGDSRPIMPTFEWYYAWQGCAVEPHCDARRKLVTHIFYFNSDDDWDPAWGGQILIMDDEGRLHRRSHPDFKDLKIAATLEARGNGSLLFCRTPHSWHGVLPLRSAPGSLRKIFICTINLPCWQVLWRRFRGKDPDGFPLSYRKAG